MNVVNKCFDRDLKMRRRRWQIKRRLKMNSRFPIVIAIVPSSLLCRMYTNSPGVEFLRTLSKLRRRKKISSLIKCLMTSSIKHEIRHFHVVVVQNVKECTKKRYVRAKLFFSCCFSYFNNLLVLKTYCFYDVHVAVAVV